MSRSNYGYVGRRSGGSAWQWIIIGLVLGFGCSVIFVLGGLAAGVITLDGAAVANLPTQTPNVIIITATPAPVTPTIAVAAPTITPTMPILLEIQPPTATPTINPTYLTLSSPLQSTQTTLGIGGNTGTGNPAIGQSAGGDLTNVIAQANETILIEGGTFAMGTTAAEVSQAVQECLGGYGGEAGNCQLEYGEDSYPQHQVTVSAFRIDRTEVSYAQYLAFMNTLGPGAHRNGCDGQPCLQTRNESETSNIAFDSATYSVLFAINDYPMTNVTWYGANVYCRAINRRLPTEAEWERAVRGRQGTIFPWGDAWDAARASTRRPLSGEPAAAPIFAFTDGGSDFGVLNMAGNVAEWVSDWYDARYYGRPEATAPDARGPLSGTTKVARGGSWDSVPFFARNPHRQDRDPLQPTAWLGFRCAEDINAQASGTSPLAAAQTFTQSDLLLPPTLVTPGTGADEEFISPTLAPAPTQAQALPFPTAAGTLAPG